MKNHFKQAKKSINKWKQIIGFGIKSNTINPIKNMDTKVLCNKRLYTIKEIIDANDDSQWDGTDAAHPAFWRGEKWSAHQFCKLVADILSGKDIGKGTMYEPLATMRRSVLRLKKERDKLFTIVEKCFVLLNKYKPDITNGSTLYIQIEKLLKKLQKEQTINKGLFKKIDILKTDLKKLQNDEYKLIARILQVEKERDELQAKYKDGVIMKCGHPSQCAYACIQNDIDKGDTGCSMCDMQNKINELESIIKRRWEC